MEYVKFKELLEQAQKYAKEFDSTFEVNQLLGVRQELLEEEIDELFDAYAEDNKTEVFDALADMFYVLGGIVNNSGLVVSFSAAKKVNLLLYGTFAVLDISFGLENYGDKSIEFADGFLPCISECLKEVHRSNLTKLEGGKPLKRADGKILKGSNYERPNLKPILERFEVI